MRYKLANSFVQGYDKVRQFSSIEFTAESFNEALRHIKEQMTGNYYPADFNLKSEGEDKAVGHYFDPLGNHVMVVLTELNEENYL